MPCGRTREGGRDARRCRTRFRIPQGRPAITATTPKLHAAIWGYLDGMYTEARADLHQKVQETADVQSKLLAINALMREFQSSQHGRIAAGDITLAVPMTIGGQPQVTIAMERG